MLRQSLFVLFAVMPLAACADDSEIAPEVEPGVVDDGKSDFTSNTLTRIVGSLDVAGAEVKDKVTSPLRFHGYTFEATAGMQIELGVSTAKKGKYYVYGPAHRFDSDGAPRFGQEIFKRETSAGWSASASSVAVTEGGTYMVVVGPRATFSTDYEVKLTCSEGCVEAPVAAKIEDLVAVFGAGVTLDEYVDADLGVHIIHRPGAIDMVQFEASIAAFQVSQPGRDLSAPVVADLKQASLPTFDCEAGFGADGAYADAVTGFTGLADLMQLLNTTFEDEIYDDAALARAAQVDGLVDVQVLTTEDGILYYFGDIDGEWKLLAIDLDRHSCSA
jgi:hypothetical protein